MEQTRIRNIIDNIEHYTYRLYLYDNNIIDYNFNRDELIEILNYFYSLLMNEMKKDKVVSNEKFIMLKKYSYIKTLK